MIQVMIIDDHRVLVEGLCRLIETSGIAEVSATGYSAKECRKMLEPGLPDVLMLDINLPDGNGVELCKELKQSYPTLKILALTSYSEYPVIREMLDNGAMGYILKNAMAEEIYLGIKEVYEGRMFLCHEIDIMLKKQPEDTIWLSQREKEVLRLIAGGYTNPEIAEKLFLSPGTVKNYRKNLLFKLGAKNTATLVRMTLEQKLV